MALAPQEDADPPIAVARVLRRERSHGCNHRCVLRGQGQLVAEGGPRDVEQPAGAALGQAVFASEPDLLAPRLRAHHFFALISLSTEMSRSRSASKRFSRAFSVSRARSRLTSAG